MSDLRRQRQAERLATSPTGEPSRFQQICTWSEDLLLFCLASWAYLKWGAKFISPAITFGGLLVIAIIFVLLHFFLRKFPQPWVTGNQVEMISSVPRKGIVIFVVLALSLILPRIVDFAAPPPQVDISLKKSSGRYAAGFSIDGIEWQENFSEHELVLRNDTGVELEDVRIDLQFPAGVVTSVITFSKGVDTISVAPFGADAARGNKAGQRVEPLKIYKMNLLVTAVRVFLTGELTTSIILIDPLYKKTVTEKSTVTSTRPDMCISFYYDDFWGYKTKHSACYPLLKDKEEDELSLSIDMKNPISPETRQLGFGVVFADPQDAKGLNVILSPNPRAKPSVER